MRILECIVYSTVHDHALYLHLACTWLAEFTQCCLPELSSADPVKGDTAPSEGIRGAV